MTENSLLLEVEMLRTKSNTPGLLAIAAIAVVIFLLSFVSILNNPDPILIETGGSLLNLAVPSQNQALSAEIAPPHWNKEFVTYRIANCPTSLDCESAKAAVRQAIEAWDAVCGLRLDELAEGGDIVVSWESGEHGDHSPFDGPGGKVAHAAYPYTNGKYWLDGDLHLDAAENWIVGDSVGPFPEEVHLKTAVMHEIGHSLGLPHSSDADSMMWPVYKGIRILSAGDVAAIQKIYGPPNEDDK